MTEIVSAEGVPMSGPDTGAREKELVNQVLDGRVLSMGAMTSRFEELIASYVGCRFGIAVNSGTAGLHLCVVAAGVGAGDKVVTSPFSFVASSNCILYEGATPVFADIDPHTYNLDPTQAAHALERLEREGNPAKALLPVHVFGQPCDMIALQRLSERHRCEMIEDACEAIGAEYQRHRVGSFGRSAVFAFYPNKQMTTGEGGMIVSDDESVARLCRSLRNQGRDDMGTWLHHVRLGYNYRIDELSAALGVAQAERLDGLIARRTKVASWYSARLRKIPGVHIPEIAATTTRMSWFVYVVRLDAKIDRDAVLAESAKRGLITRLYFSPIHLQPFYRERFGLAEGMFPVTEAVAKSTFALPFSGVMSEDEVERVCGVLRSVLV